MNEKEIGAKIRDRLRSGSLPPNIPIPDTPGQNFDVFSLHTGGVKCSACDEDSPDFTVKYSDGKTFSLHHDCHRIWKEEREKIIYNDAKQCDAPRPFTDAVKHQTADTVAEILDEPILVTLGHEGCAAILEDIRTHTTPYTLDGFRVWLPTIPLWLRERAIAALKKDDVGAFIRKIHSRNRLALVACNISLLQHRGLYEAALLKAFVLSATNRLRDPLLFQRSLFMLADRHKLRDAGDPLPSPGPYTLYRGVAGVGKFRRERGLSWTGSLEMATEFAMMYDSPDPVVFEATVSEQEILTYTHSDMKEDEYIVMLSRQTRIKRLPIDLTLHLLDA